MSQLNVDPQEIAKFEALAAKWWDQHSEFRPLHQINPLRLNWIDERVGGLAGKKVLDVGCGGGILAESMARRGADVLGIDMGEAPLAVGRLHAQQENVQNIEYRQIPVEQLALEQAGQYDVVTCMEMMEHVPDPASIVQACQNLVKPVVMCSFQPLIAIQNPIYLRLLAQNMYCAYCQRAHMIIINSSALQKWHMIFAMQV